MGATNNSLVKLQDIVDSGGIKTENFSIDENKLLNDIEITTRQQQTGQVHLGPLCYNVTLKNNYGKGHLTKFQDLDIAKTYPITLAVTIPNGMTGYTLHGFTAKVTYPNNLVKSHSIDITETTSDTNIVLENCCDNAKVKVSTNAENSGATISDSMFRYNANVSISPLFTRGDGLTCTGEAVYSCFTLTDASFTPGGPVITGDTGTSRDVVISINTKNILSDNQIFIENAKYATGATPSEVQNNSDLTWFEIPELSKQVFSNLPASSAAVKTTISVPTNSYVAIYLADPLDKRITSTYKWNEGNYQYIQANSIRNSVTYTITIKN